MSPPTTGNLKTRSEAAGIVGKNGAGLRRQKEGGILGCLQISAFRLATETRRNYPA